MARQYLSGEDTAVVLIDHSVGFANLYRSHTPAENRNGAVALAKLAQVYGAPLVVTNGPDGASSGPLYPELKAALGDHPVVVREGTFDAFLYQPFADAVEATGRRRLVMAGLMTEGCLLQTALSAIDRGYEAFTVLDASAGETRETHEMAILRMTQAGVVPATWFSLASEFQRTWDNVATLGGFMQLIGEHNAPFAMQGASNANIERYASLSAAKAA